SSQGSKSSHVLHIRVLSTEKVDDAKVAPQKRPARIEILGKESVDQFTVNGITISIEPALDNLATYVSFLDRLELNIGYAFAHPEPGYSPEETVRRAVRHELAHRRYSLLPVEAQIKIVQAALGPLSIVTVTQVV